MCQVECWSSLTIGAAACWTVLFPRCQQRPWIISNVAFHSMTQCYLISGFGTCVFTDQEEPCFLSSERKQIRQHEFTSKHKHFDVNSIIFKFLGNPIFKMFLRYLSIYNWNSYLVARNKQVNKVNFWAQEVGLVRVFVKWPFAPRVTSVVSVVREGW